MKKTALIAAGLLGSGVVLALSAAPTSLPQIGPQTFELTITNLTPGQIFSPVLVATHDASASVFRAGGKASPELAILAEDGDNTPLQALLLTLPAVHDVASGSGMVMPGASQSILIEATQDSRLLSLASMLVTTNDTFAGIDSLRLPAGSEAIFAFAYDAGSEANSELCNYIPGPPCGSAGMHDPAQSEGVITVANGIHGIGDLQPATWDWRGPVAQIVIRRL